MLACYINTTNLQKVLNFLARNSGKIYYEREVAKELNLNPSSVYAALKNLEKNALVVKEIKGKMCFYGLNDINFQTKEIKIMAILLFLEDLIEKLQPVTDEIILFGSCADGTYDRDSDIDLFIESSKKKEVNEAINAFVRKTKEGKKIQAVIRNPREMLGEKDSLFLKQVRKGKILFEREIL